MTCQRCEEEPVVGSVQSFDEDGALLLHLLVCFRCLLIAQQLRLKTHLNVVKEIHID